MRIPLLIIFLAACASSVMASALAYNTVSAAPLGSEQPRLGSWHRLTNTKNDDKPLTGSTRWLVTADKIEYPAQGLVIGTGHVSVLIDGQNASLKSADVSFDKGTAILKAEGNVQIIRKGVLTTGASYAFRADSPDYLVTESNVRLSEPRFIERP